MYVTHTCADTKEKVYGAGEMAQHWRLFQRTLLPSSHMAAHTIWNSSSKGSEVLFWVSGALHA